MMTNWTKEEFKAYILLFASQANFIEAEEERELILSKVDSSILKKMKVEFKKDNDYQCIKKIEENLEFHKYSNNELNHLKEEVKDVLKSDGTYDILEKNTFRFLKKLLK